MNLDELRSVQAKERRKDSLQHLRDAFYDDVAAYTADLRAARDRRAESVENPFADDDVRRMSDEVETAEEVSEALYERRVGKVVKLASFAAADMPVEREGMTSQERDLFEDLVSRIERNKRSVLDVLSGDVTPNSDGVPTDSPRVEEDSPTSKTGAPGETGQDPDSPEDAGLLADAMGTESAGPDDSEPTSGSGADVGRDGPTPVDPEPAPPGALESGSTGSDNDTADVETGDASGDDGSRTDGSDDSAESGERTTVRITRDVGEILGVDEREYDLATEDVVTLPSANAEPLLQRDAAERID